MTPIMLRQGKKETSNGSIEFNDAMIMIMLFVEIYQRICEEQK